MLHLFLSSTVVAMDDAAIQVDDAARVPSLLLRFMCTPGICITEQDQNDSYRKRGTPLV